MTATNAEQKTCSFCAQRAVVRTRFQYCVVDVAKPGTTIRVRSKDRAPWFACEEHRKALSLSPLVDVPPPVEEEFIIEEPAKPVKRVRDLDVVWAFREHFDLSFCPKKRTQIDVVAEFWQRGSLLGFFKMTLQESAFCPWRSTVEIEGSGIEAFYDADSTDALEAAEREAVEKIFLRPCAEKHADGDPIKFHMIDDVELLGW